MTERQKHTVLIVDDEMGVLNALRRLLDSREISIKTATRGQDALELLKSEKISLIISDQRMPEMTGVEFLQRSREISPESIRILLTGYADIETSIKAINEGAVKYYLNKPWNDEFLLSRVQESLNLFEVTAENKRLNELIQIQNDQLKNLNKNLEQRVTEQTMEIKAQHKELARSFFETIKAFSTIVDLRFKEVGSHSQRVASLTKHLLKGFKLGKKEYQDIVIAAYLHDIGKVVMPDRMLEKHAHDYAKADIDEIQKHPILGQSCLYGISGFEEISLIIRHHHENYDGSGYPDQLREMRIPLGSRIIRIVNSFVNQAFSQGYPNLKVLNESSARIVEFSGSKFDPDLVKKFIELDGAKQFLISDSDSIIVVKAWELEAGMVVAEDITTSSSMFLLPKGAKLSSGMIKRIIKIDKFDPIPKGVCIYKESKPAARKEEHATL